MEDAAPYTTAAHMRQLAERMDAERNELTSDASVSYFRACAPTKLLPLLSHLEAQLAAAETAAASVAAERDHWKQEARAHASRATVMELGHCNGQCGICNGECEPLAPPASAPVAPVAGVAAGEVAQEGGSRG